MVSSFLMPVTKKKNIAKFYYCALVCCIMK